MSSRGDSHSDASVCSGPTTLEHLQQMSCHILCEVCSFSLDVRFIFPSTLHMILFKVDFRSEKASESEGESSQPSSADRRRHTGGWGRQTERYRQGSRGRRRKSKFWELLGRQSCEMSPDVSCFYFGAFTRACAASIIIWLHRSHT